MRLILFLLFIGAFASLGVLSLRDPGSIEMTWLGYEVELTAVLALFILLLSFFIIILLGYGVSWFFEIFAKWGIFLKLSRDKKVKNELMEFFSCYEAEAFKEALHHQKKGKPYLANHPLFLWISGNIFEKTGQYVEAAECFISLTKNPFTTFLGLKGQIRASMHRGDFKLAYTLLKRAEKIIPTSPWVLKHLLGLACEQKDFENAEKLILRLEDLAIFTSEQGKKQIAHLDYQQALQPKLSLSQKEVYLRQSHQLDPSCPEVAETFVGVLKQQGHITYALTVLETTWKLTPTQKLGDLYLVLVKPRDDLEAFQVAQNFVKDNSEDSESLLFLARTAFKAKLWGEARSFLNLLLKKNPTAPVYQLLAHLELKEKEDWQAAIKWLEEGLHAPRAVMDWK